MIDILLYIIVIILIITLYKNNSNAYENMTPISPNNLITSKLPSNNIPINNNFDTFNFNKPISQLMPYSVIPDVIPSKFYHAVLNNYGGIDYINELSPNVLNKKTYCYTKPCPEGLKSNLICWKCRKRYVNRLDEI